jgi:hypothetical protein
MESRKSIFKIQIRRQSLKLTDGSAEAIAALGAIDIQSRKVSGRLMRWDARARKWRKAKYT